MARLSKSWSSNTDFTLYKKEWDFRATPTPKRIPLVNVNTGRNAQQGVASHGWTDGNSRVELKKRSLFCRDKGDVGFNKTAPGSYSEASFQSNVTRLVNKVIQETKITNTYILPNFEKILHTTFPS